MKEKYYIFAFEEKVFDSIISNTDINTDESYMMVVGWDSKLGKEIRKKAKEKDAKGRSNE
ncbi:hypothetical protein LCGC14_1164840 [marine sediment metagenome]|uniref:Uncharacterized protein n=1 Tax=marine sediment metagenome TaxID=412755 RepID=A0A0F9LRR3_9ZZZZ